MPHEEILILKISFSANVNNKQMAFASSNIAIPWLYTPDVFPGSLIFSTKPERKISRIHFKQGLKVTLYNTFKSPILQLRIWKYIISFVYRGYILLLLFYLKRRYREILSES